MLNLFLLPPRAEPPLATPSCPRAPSSPAAARRACNRLMHLQQARGNTHASTSLSLSASFPFFQIEWLQLALLPFQHPYEPYDNDNRATIASAIGRCISPSIAPTVPPYFVAQRRWRQQQGGERGRGVPAGASALDLQLTGASGGCDEERKNIRMMKNRKSALRSKARKRVQMLPL